MAETGNQRDLTKGEKTKYRLARAMKECMKKAPVEKITVKEITEECGVTRQTFYRNLFRFPGAHRQMQFIFSLSIHKKMHGKYTYSFSF